jgi:hypothetical protein
MNEVRGADDERARELARHHLLIAQRYIIDDIRSSIAEHARYAAMSPAEIKLAGARTWGNAAECAFRSFRVMDRLEPAFAAVQKIASGKLVPDLEDIQRKIWQVLENVDSTRERFYATPRGAARQSVDLSRELAPMGDTLSDLIVSFYRIARELYNLPEMKIDGRVIH